MSFSEPLRASRLTIEMFSRAPGFRQALHRLVKVLHKLPFLSKETLRTKARALLTQDPPPPRTVIFNSSGTTGTPTSIYCTPRFHSLEVAIPAARELPLAGVTHRSRRVMFGVRKVCRFEQRQPPFWRFSPAENIAYCSIYHLSPRFLPHYVDFLRAYQPDIIMGYPSSLHTLAMYALKTNDLPAPAKVVVTTSETLSLQARSALERVWQCRVQDRYGAVEGCVFASQCEYGRYHVSPDVGIVEIVDRFGQPQPAGRIGDVVCTGLHNTLQPLIRYQIGDVAAWAAEQRCPCNRQMPIIEGVEGRSEDICFTPDGRQMLRFDPVFKGVDRIREAQVIQEELDLFVVRVTPSDGFGAADVERIQANLRAHAGQVRVQVVEVPAIDRTPSGKFRAVMCRLSDADKARFQHVHSPN